MTDTETKPNPHLNHELMRKVRDAILLHPEDFDMGTWFDGHGLVQVVNSGDLKVADRWYSDPEVNPNDVTDLGELPEDNVCCTTACYAGWAISIYMAPLVFTVVDSEHFIDKDGYETYIPGAAKELLGLKSSDLFHEAEWPVRFRFCDGNAAERAAKLTDALLSGEVLDTRDGLQDTLEYDYDEEDDEDDYEDDD